MQAMCLRENDFRQQGNVFCLYAKTRDPSVKKEREMYQQFDPADTSIVGAAEEALRDPRGQKVEPQPTGVPFDYNRPQQNWVVPDATEDLPAFKLARKGGAPDFDSPHLVTYAVPVQWATKPNIQENPSLDGVVQ